MQRSTFLEWRRRRRRRRRRMRWPMNKALDSLMIFETRIGDVSRKFICMPFRIMSVNRFPYNLSTVPLVGMPETSKKNFIVRHCRDAHTHTQNGARIYNMYQ